MKRIIAMLLMLCLLVASVPALAQTESYTDNPFQPGVDYSKKYKDYGAMPSMLNFGCVDVNELQAARSITDSSVTKTTITEISASRVLESLVNQDTLYYIYAKWQTAKAMPDTTIDTMLVLTDPTGKQYSQHQDIFVEGISGKYRYTGLGYFFDATNLLIRSYLENGEFVKGKYIFSMYFNDQFFRTNNEVIFE